MSPPANRLITITACIFIVATVLLWLWESKHQESPGAGERIAESAREWVEQLNQPEGGRVVVRHPPVEAMRGAEKKDRLELGEITSLGPLNEEQLVWARGLLGRLKTTRAKAADRANRTSNDTDPESMFEAADALYEATAAELAAGALDRGFYYVQPAGKQVFPSVKDAYIMGFPAPLDDGREVAVTLVIPHKEYPHLADAYTYRNVIKRYYLQSVCDEFNRREYAYRSALLERHRTATADQRRADGAFKRFFQKGLSVDRQTAILRIHD